jgi:hypothetical protein
MVLHTVEAHHLDTLEERIRKVVEWVYCDVVWNFW